MLIKKHGAWDFGLIAKGISRGMYETSIVKHVFLHSARMFTN